MEFTLWLFIAGALLIVMGISHLKSKYDEPVNSDLYEYRFIQSMRGIGVGIMCLVIAVVSFFFKGTNILVAQSLLVFGIISIVFAASIFSSRRMADYLWKFLWKSEDQKKDRRGLLLALLVLGLGLLVCSYIFSGI